MTKKVLILASNAPPWRKYLREAYEMGKEIE